MCASTMVIQKQGRAEPGLRKHGVYRCVAFGASKREPKHDRQIIV